MEKKWGDTPSATLIQMPYHAKVLFKLNKGEKD